VPVECAAASVWQPPQPELPKIFAPPVGSPFSLNAGTIGNCGAWGSVPITLFGVGLTTPSAPHPASTPHERTMRTVRRTGGHSIAPEYHAIREAEVLRTRPGPDPTDARHRRAPRPALRRLRRRALLGPERRDRAGADHRHRARVLPVLHL